MNILLSVLLWSSVSLFAQDPKDFSDVVQSLSKKLIASNATDRPQRLAVVTFVSTKAQSKDRNEFGEYITESLISALNSGKSSFKLFERKRLDAVLKENDLLLSDLVDATAAVKVGELVPIDVLFSGTYTKLKNYVDVNGRLIDVVTGEIHVSFSGRIKLTEDITSLFSEDVSPSGSTGDEPKISDDERCKQYAKDFRIKLSDLSTTEKINSIVSDAVKTPFDMRCGAIHFDMLYSFTRYKVDNPRYHRFLLKTLDTITLPDRDERAKEIIRFFGKDGAVDAEEWKTGLTAIRRMGSYQIYIGLDKLFPIDDNSPLAEYFTRIDEYIDLAQNKGIGLPKPISFNQAYFFMTDGFKDKLPLLMYVYERYADRLEWDDKIRKKMSGILATMYKNASLPADKKKLIQWMAEFYNQSEISEKSADQLFNFVRSFARTTNKERNKEISQAYPDADLSYFASLCADRISKLAPLTQYPSQKEERINFCLEYNIPVPGLIPTMAEAQSILDGQNWEEQKQTMALLEKMGSKPKPLEKSIVKLLDKRSLDHQSELKDMQESALVILGHIRSAEPKAIQAMIESLTSREYGLPDKAKDALVEIGKPVVPHLLQRWNSLTNQDGGLKYSLAVIFSRIGKDAIAAKAILQSALSGEKNKDVRYAIEAALQAME